MTISDMSSDEGAQGLHHAVSRSGFLKLGGFTAGGLMLGGGLASGSAAMARQLSTAAAGPLAGKTVGISTPVNIQVLIEFFANMKKQAATPANGEKINVVNANGDSVKQHADVATMIQQGDNALLMLLLSASGWDKTVLDATKKGIGMFNHSASAVRYMTQNVGLDQRQAGFLLGQIAAAWIKKTQGGTADVAILPILNDPQLILRGKGIEAALKQYAPGAKIVGQVHAQLEAEGATAAANLLQSNPNLKMILTAGDDPGLGAYTAATEAGKKVSTDFFIGSCDGTDAVLAKIAQKGIYQATADFLFPFSSTQLERDIEKFLRGQHVQPTRIMKPIGVSAANLQHVQAISKNPRAANVQYIYKTNMKYSNYKLKTNEPFAHAFS
jgi:ABC-type sugar transport system substrate-binding protein